MSKSQRDKGARGENEFCKLLEDEFGVKANRNLGQARDGGNDIHFCEMVHFEVKRRASLKTLEGWMKQAQITDAPMSAVAMRADGGKWMVMLDWPTFARLLRSEFV